jgi:2-polyprenyl-6-hydroxyphenyl methylase/3-demethylubiquinone-9 3-methyltransferase
VRRVDRARRLVFFSTINRNPKAYVFAIVAAEYILKLLPRGTHDYSRFITPAELAQICRAAGLSPHRVTGMTYNPFTRTYALGTDSSVNYILSAQAS